jgi:hypothetical protein
MRPSKSLCCLPQHLARWYGGTTVDGRHARHGRRRNVRRIFADCPDGEDLVNANPLGSRPPPSLSPCVTPYDSPRLVKRAPCDGFMSPARVRGSISISPWTSDISHTAPAAPSLFTESFVMSNRQSFLQTAFGAGAGLFATNIGPLRPPLPWAPALRQVTRRLRVFTNSLRSINDPPCKTISSMSEKY